LLFPNQHEVGQMLDEGDIPSMPTKHPGERAGVAASVKKDFHGGGLFFGSK
jgi:hypothetical protein